MAKSSTFANQFLLHVLQNAAISLVGDATGLPAAGAAGNLYMSLHTANPTAGDQSTSEAAYTSYARVAIARTSGGFTVSANVASTAAITTFPTGTGGGEAATYWGIGTSSSGAGKLLWSNLLSGTITTGNGVTPTVAAGTMVTET